MKKTTTIIMMALLLLIIPSMVFATDATKAVAYGIQKQAESEQQQSPPQPTNDNNKILIPLLSLAGLWYITEKRNGG